MKHHVHTLILLASLTITWLLCSCRTTYQKDRSAQEQSNLSISDSTLYDRTGDIYSRFNFNKEEADKGWKIKVNSIAAEAQSMYYPVEKLPPKRFAGALSPNSIISKYISNETAKTATGTS